MEKSWARTIGLMGVCVLFVCGCRSYMSDFQDYILYNAQGVEKLPEGFLSLQGWKSFPIDIYIADDFTFAQIELIKKGLAVWEVVAGKQLFSYAARVEGVDNGFSVNLGLLKDFRSTFYVDNQLGKYSGIATTMYRNNSLQRNHLDAQGYPIKYIIASDIFLQMYEYSVSTSDFVGLNLATIVHEVGHMLGLGHLSAADYPHSIMLSRRTSARELPSRGDIKRLHRIYGCHGKACDVEYVLSLLNSESCCVLMEERGSGKKRLRRSTKPQSAKAVDVALPAYVHLDFVPDMELLRQGKILSRGWDTLPLKVVLLAGFQDAQKKLIRKQLSLWEEALGRKLFHVLESVAEGSLPEEDHVVWHLKAWKGGNRLEQMQSVLHLVTGSISDPPSATTVSGDVYLHAAKYGMYPKTVLRMAGHLLGLGVPLDDEASVMHPDPGDGSSAFDVPSKQDIQRLRELYDK